MKLKLLILLAALFVLGSGVYAYREHRARVCAEAYAEGLAKELRLCESR